MDSNGPLQKVWTNGVRLLRRRTLAPALVGTILFGSVQAGSAQEGRKYVAFPDIPGYLTLRADFHMHTIFSDGVVLPGYRVLEAWREGLDVMAITDHDSFLPEFVVGDRNTPFQMAEEAARDSDILLIRSSEITRGVGHFNALFLEDANAVVGKGWYEAIKEAAAQGAFIQLNHPPPDAWGEEVERLKSEGLLHGVEVFNGKRRYYDYAHRWSIERGLTVMGNSDLHVPSAYTYGRDPAGHRPMTLVFAAERSKEAVREALFAGRTAVYESDMLYGSEEYLRPLFDGCIEVLTPETVIDGPGRIALQVLNDCDVDLRLVPPSGSRVPPGRGSSEDVVVSASNAVLLPAHRIARVNDRHLAASVFTSLHPERIPGALEWRFEQPQPGWKVLQPLPFPPEIRPARVSQSDDALRVTLGSSNANQSGLLVGSIFVDVPDWDHTGALYVVIRARSSGPGVISPVFNVGDQEEDPGPGQRFPYRAGEVRASLVGDSTVQTYLFLMESEGASGDSLEQLGLWIGAPAPRTVDILSVTVVPRDAFYAEQPAGVRRAARGRLRYRVSNLWVAPETGLDVEIPVTVRLTPAG